MNSSRTSAYLAVRRLNLGPPSRTELPTSELYLELYLTCMRADSTLEMFSELTRDSMLVPGSTCLVDAGDALDASTEKLGISFKIEILLLSLTCCFLESSRSSGDCSSYWPVA